MVVFYPIQIIYFLQIGMVNKLTMNVQDNQTLSNEYLNIDIVIAILGSLGLYMLQIYTQYMCS